MPVKGNAAVLGGRHGHRHAPGVPPLSAYDTGAGAKPGGGCLERVPWKHLMHTIGCCCPRSRFYWTRSFGAAWGVLAGAAVHTSPRANGANGPMEVSSFSYIFRTGRLTEQRGLSAQLSTQDSSARGPRSTILSLSAVPTGTLLSVTTPLSRARDPKRERRYCTAS